MWSKDLLAFCSKLTRDEEVLVKGNKQKVWVNDPFRREIWLRDLSVVSWFDIKPGEFITIVLQSSALITFTITDDTTSVMAFQYQVISRNIKLRGC